MKNHPKHNKTVRNRFLGFGTSADLAESYEDRGGLVDLWLQANTYLGLEMYN